VGALEGEEPPPRSFEAGNDALFRERARTVFVVIMAGAGAFFLLGVLLQERALAPRVVIKVTVFLLGLGGVVAL
jgi:hypothetical protein